MADSDKETALKKPISPGVQARFGKLIADAYEQGKDGWLPAFYEHEFRDNPGSKGFRKYIRSCQHDLRQLGTSLEGKRVLDAGCGAGKLALLVALLGASDVQGIDTWHVSLQASRGLVESVAGEGLPITITEMNAACLEFPDESFDIVICREAISHFDKPHDFLAEAARVMRPGGKLFISDHNNGANPLRRMENCEIWKRVEKGPAGRVSTHMVNEPLEDIRRKRIQEAYPDMSAEDAQRLAANTFRMLNAEVIEAARVFRETGQMPNRVYKRGVCPIHPDTAMTCEQLFSPYGLAKDISVLGLRARVRAYFSHGRHPVLSVISNVLESVSVLTMPAAQAFQIVATKT